MSGKHEKKVEEHYTPNVSRNKKGYVIADWSSMEAQEARFEVLTEEIFRHGLVRGASLLDVGCGMADLWSYLNTRGIAPEYHGVDITPAVLKEAKRRNPGLDLSNGDVFSGKPPYMPGSFDIVFCSGVFNLKQDNSPEFAKRGVIRLAQLSSKLTVVNFLHKRASYKYDMCFYLEPSEILDELENGGWSAVVRDDYLENDFSVIIRSKNGK